MVDHTLSLDIFVQLFVLGAFLFFLACSLASVVMLVHLGSLPERRAPQPEAQPQGSPVATFAD